MSRKKESTFIAKTHRQLKKLTSAYIWKIHASSQNGIADCYYSGRCGDLWIEYKFVDELPAKDASHIKTGLSPLQQQWLKGRFEEGRNVALVIGSPFGVVILDKGIFPLAVSRRDFIRSAVPLNQVIEYILSRIDPQCLS